MALHLYEFLYRGRPEGSEQAPGYHVILADDGKDAFGQPTLAISEPMTPEQAEARGMSLPKVISGINSDLMAENEALRAENTALKAAAGRS